MGGSSSKDKSPKAQTYSKKPKKAKEAKGKSVKAKANRKGSAQWSRADGEEGEVTFVPGGRRKSCDDLDVQQPPPRRDRSKSLRFGDFTQLDRQRKVDDSDLLPVDIAFFQEGKVEPEELCHVCSVYTGSETLVCGVCYRVFHEGCLAKIGQWSGPPDILASSSMWSCHQCANLGNLLTEQEVIDVLKRLDKCGIRREDDLTLADYLAYCRMSLQEDEGKILTREKEDNAKRRFQQVDSGNRGRVTWCQFLNIETVRILNKRSKNSLVRLLTSPELERARDAFRILDTDKDGRITKETAHFALDRHSRRSGYYPDETMMYIDEDLEESISWTDFLRDRAIYIIAERPCLRASPLDQSTRRRSSNRSTIADASSLPVTPITETPPLPRGKGVSRSLSQTAVKSAAITVTVSKQQQQLSHPQLTVLRHSDGAVQAAGGRAPSVQVSAMMVPQDLAGGRGEDKAAGSGGGRKHSASIPALPPPPPSSRSGSSHHLHRGSASVPSTPVKSSAPDFPPQQRSSQPGHTHHHDGSSQSPRGSAHSEGGLRLSGGSDISVGGTPRRLSGHGHGGEQQVSATASVYPRREVPRRSSQGDSASGSGHHVTGKPPMGSHSRAGGVVAAPPYGKLVERVQKGEYRQTQARSMLLSSGTTNTQATPTFGHVMGDTNTGRRPLSLV